MVHTLHRVILFADYNTVIVKCKERRMKFRDGFVGRMVKSLSIFGGDNIGILR